MIPFRANKKCSCLFKLRLFLNFLNEKRFLTADKINSKMLLQIITKLSTFDSIKQSLRYLVLYFIYFAILLLWMQSIGVNAQGNRGVIINNQKIDDNSSDIHNVKLQAISSSIATKLLSSSTSQVILLREKNKNDFFYKKNEEEGKNEWKMCCSPL